MVAAAAAAEIIEEAVEEEVETVVEEEVGTVDEEEVRTVDEDGAGAGVDLIPTSKITRATITDKSKMKRKWDSLQKIGVEMRLNLNLKPWKQFTSN